MGILAGKRDKQDSAPVQHKYDNVARFYPWTLVYICSPLIMHLDSEHPVKADDIKQIAQLARIAIKDDAIDEIAKRMNQVLELVDQLQQVDTSDVAPMAHPLDAVQRLRADEVSEPDQRDALLAIAPETEQGLILVPKVIE